MITLYQMPISHFSEKIRWALAYKRLPHKYKNLLPGLHARTTMKLSGQSSVPVIKEGGNIIHDSTAIIDYLDKEFPRFLLTPEDESEREQALEWERWAGEQVGVAVRVLAYSTILDRPDILKPVMAQDGPWYGGLYMNKAYPKIRATLESKLKLNEQRIAEARQTLGAASEKIRSAQPNLAPILDSGFSRADLTLASLWAPLFSIGKFGVNWPADLPPEYQAFSTEFADMKEWVEHIYSKYR